ncbi:MAG: beta-1,6-N-acetylglucosaminyltransferase, partial [Gemmobacter sp.]
NERQRKWLFYKSLELQRKFGLSRSIPEDLKIRIGSQWWCLRRRTVEAVLDFVMRRRDIPRFFSTTWIPDETFFQTLVAHLVPDREIRLRPLTFL